MPDAHPVSELLDPFTLMGTDHVPVAEVPAGTRQVRAYICPECGARYQHSDGYRHATRECPYRAISRAIVARAGFSVGLGSVVDRRSGCGGATIAANTQTG